MWWYQCKKMSFCFLRIMNIVSPVTKKKKKKKKKKEGRGGNEKHIEQFHSFWILQGSLPIALAAVYTFGARKYTSAIDLRACLIWQLTRVLSLCDLCPTRAPPFCCVDNPCLKTPQVFAVNTACKAWSDAGGCTCITSGCPTVHHTLWPEEKNREQKTRGGSSSALPFRCLPACQSWLHLTASFEFLCKQLLHIQPVLLKGM